MPVIPTPESDPLAVAAVAVGPHSMRPLASSLDDRWAAWVASERQRDQDAQHEIRTALLLMVVAVALGGAIYLSFGGQQ